MSPPAGAYRWVTRGPKGLPGPLRMVAPIGTRVIDSTPAATTTSYAPAITPWAAKCRACWPDPHCRSTVVPGTVSGNPAARAALRARFRPCSPVWLTQPAMTSSIRAGSRSLRSTRARRTWAARSTGCQSRSAPLRRPSGLRTASTITAVAMGPFCPPGPGIAVRSRAVDVAVNVVVFVLGAVAALGTLGSAVRTVVLPRGIPARLSSLVFVVLGRVYRLRIRRTVVTDLGTVDVAGDGSPADDRLRRAD